MTNLGRIIHSSDNWLYLSGKRKAYISKMGVTCGRANKSEFEQLLNGCKDMIVIVDKDTAKKYALRINRLGYILQDKYDYGALEYILYYLIA